MLTDYLTSGALKGVLYMADVVGVVACFLRVFGFFEGAEKNWIFIGYIQIDKFILFRKLKYPIPPLYSSFLCRNTENKI